MWLYNFQATPTVAPGLFFKGNSTAKLLKISQQQKKEPTYKRCCYRRFIILLIFRTSHSFSLYLIPYLKPGTFWWWLKLMTQIFVQRFDFTPTVTSIGPANDHDYGKVVIPWRTDILTKEEAMYLKQEVERWKDEVETLKRKNQELQQHQPQQLLNTCQYDHKKMETDLKMRW